MTTQACRHALSDPHYTQSTTRAQRVQRRFLTGKLWTQHCSPGWRGTSGTGRQLPGVIPETASLVWLP